MLYSAGEVEKSVEASTCEHGRGVVAFLCRACFLGGSRHVPCLGLYGLEGAGSLESFRGVRTTCMNWHIFVVSQKYIIYGIVNVLWERKTPMSVGLSVGDLDP